MFFSNYGSEFKATSELIIFPYEPGKLPVTTGDFTDAYNPLFKFFKCILKIKNAFLLIYKLTDTHIPR